MGKNKSLIIENVYLSEKHTYDTRISIISNLEQFSISKEALIEYLKNQNKETLFDCNIIFRQKYMGLKHLNDNIIQKMIELVSILKEHNIKIETIDIMSKNAHFNTYLLKLLYELNKSIDTKNIFLKLEDENKINEEIIKELPKQDLKQYLVELVQTEKFSVHPMKLSEVEANMEEYGFDEDFFKLFNSKFIQNNISFEFKPAIARKKRPQQVIK